MKSKYILFALLGTKNPDMRDDYPFRPLYAKVDDIATLPSFEKRDISEEPEFENEDMLPAGIMGIFDPATKETRCIQAYMDKIEWLDISMIASYHITGDGEEGENGHEGN